MRTAIEIHNLTVAYDKKPVLWNIDCSLPEGKIIGVLGPNGSGKTTLLKSILGLLPVSSGYVEVFDKSISESISRISYVPQRESVDWNFPTSVIEVVRMGRYSRKNLFRRLSKNDRVIADEALKKVGMEAFAKRQIAQLSGGQQQRVFLARSLAQQADLYIMDEPFVGVDAATESAILLLLQELKEENKTVVLVHHDLQTAQAYFDWIVLLNTRLVASGPVEETLNNKNLQEAYGGKLTLLNEMGELIRKNRFPIRERTEEKEKI